MSCEVALPSLAADANKYSRGKLVVVAGSSRYPGAAVLAARAGQRMGVGYTEVITAKSAVNVVRMSSPSLVVRPFSQWSPAELPEALPEKPCAVCIGPGFVPGAEKSDRLVVSVLREARCPVLVDGGALGCLPTKAAVKQLRQRAENGYPTVVTPHGGEAARLAKPLRLASADAEQVAAALALALQCVVVLKGPDTYLSDGRRTEVMTEGTAALAKAGTGDVLAGMISSLLAQGVDAFSAAMTGAVLHARAGVEAAKEFTEVAVCAEDVLEAIPQAIAGTRSV